MSAFSRQTDLIETVTAAIAPERRKTEYNIPLDGVRALQHSLILGLRIVQPAIVVLGLVVRGQLLSAPATVSSETD
jgi:hypothetical protein